MIESLTLEEALALFSLPRNLGPYEGEDLVIGIGKFGPYVRHLSLIHISQQCENTHCAGCILFTAQT